MVRNGGTAAWARTSRSTGFIQSLVWLGLGLGFTHIFLGTGRTVPPALHQAMAVAAALSFVLAMATAASRQRPSLVSLGGAIAATLFTVVLLLANLAHETGLLLLVGGLLNATLAWRDRSFALRTPPVRPGDRP
jgi:hypothetical protein